MVGWHPRLNGHEFEQALGAGDGQGGLAGCSPGVTESDRTERLNNDWDRCSIWQQGQVPLGPPGCGSGAGLLAGNMEKQLELELLGPGPCSRGPHPSVPLPTFSFPLTFTPEHWCSSPMCHMPRQECGHRGWRTPGSHDTR